MAISSSDGKKATFGLIIQACFLLIFISVAISMGFFFIEFASNWPEWGPGPHPSLFTWIPFAMAGFGVLMLLGIISSHLKNRKIPDSYHRYQSSVDTYSTEEVSTYEASGYSEPTFIRAVPNYCNNCGSKIDDRSVEWVGPMTFICPYCGQRQRAERKAI